MDSKIEEEDKANYDHILYQYYVQQEEHHHQQEFKNQNKHDHNFTTTFVLYNMIYIYQQNQQDSKSYENHEGH